MGVSKVEDPREYEYEKYITVEGIKIRYIVKGAGSPLLLLHGFSEFLETWDFNIRPLSECYQVYAIDLPGHGLSDNPDTSYNISFFTESATGFMQALGIDRTSIIGHSLGGLISLNIAINFPEKVSKLILESSLGLSDDVLSFHKLCSIPVLTDADADESEVRAALDERMKRGFYAPDFIAEEVVERSYRFMQMPGVKRVPLSILHNWLSVDGLKPEVVMIDKLHLIKSPTLLIHGAQDNIHPPELSQRACNLIPDARLKIFSECGHCPHIEKAAEFNEAVISFLKANEPDSLSV